MPMPMHFWLVGIDLEAGGMNISEAHQRWWSPFPIRDLILGTPAGLHRTRRALEVFSRKRLLHGSSKKNRNCFDPIIFIVEIFLEALSAIITFKNHLHIYKFLVWSFCILCMIICKPFFRKSLLPFDIESKSFAECTVTEILFWS